MISRIEKANKKSESCLIDLTNGSIKYGNLSLAKYGLAMLPRGIVGPTNLKNGRGKEVELFLDGLDEVIKTDVPADKKIFRQRARIKEFIRFHKLKVNDKVILERKGNAKFKLKPANAPFTFIDLFAGIGGTRMAFEKAGCKCVFSSEWDKFAQQTYEANFGEKPEGDIRKIPSSQIPDHDILVAGFPCQPFSISGVSKKNSLGKPHGFDDPTQGTLFFEIKRIIQDKRPSVFLLENVKNLRSHDKGNTYKTIMATLEKLGYTIFDAVIDADAYVPQHRERIFIVGFREPAFFSFPQYCPEKKPKFRSILQKNVPDKYTLTDHQWNYHQNYAAKHKKKGNGFGYGMADLDGRSRTLSARYYKDGSEIFIPRGKGKNPRRLTPQECANLMGFTQLKPDFKIPVSNTQAYKQFGNSVVVPLIYDIAKELLKTLKKERN